jgi:hypothetical protein
LGNESFVANYSQSGNKTINLESDPYYALHLKIWFTVTLLFCFFGAGNNVLLLILTFRMRNLLNPAVYFLLSHLIIIYIVNCVLVLPIGNVSILLSLYEIRVTDQFCSVYQTIYVTLFAVAAWIDGCLAVNRVMAICFPFHFSRSAQRWNQSTKLTFDLFFDSGVSWGFFHFQVNPKQTDIDCIGGLRMDFHFSLQIATNIWYNREIFRSGQQPMFRQIFRLFGSRSQRNWLLRTVQRHWMYYFADFTQVGCDQVVRSGKSGGHGAAVRHFADETVAAKTDIGEITFCLFSVECYLLRPADNCGIGLSQGSVHNTDDGLRDQIFCGFDLYSWTGTNTGFHCDLVSCTFNSYIFAASFLHFQ